MPGPKVQLNTKNGGIPKGYVLAPTSRLNDNACKHNESSCTVLIRETTKTFWSFSNNDKKNIIPPLNFALQRYPSSAKYACLHIMFLVTARTTRLIPLLFVFIVSFLLAFRDPGTLMLPRSLPCRICWFACLLGLCF